MEKQNRFRQTLLAAQNALEQTGIRFFLASGTALGACREGNFLEYDNDIDLGVFATELHPEIKKLMCQGGFVLVKEMGTPHSGYCLKFRHNESRVKLDVFAYYEEKEYMWYATHGGRVCRCMVRGFCRWKFQRFDLQPIGFLGASFLIPSPPKQYLTDKYGADWETPKNYNYIQGISHFYKNRIDEFSILRATQVRLDETQEQIQELRKRVRLRLKEIVSRTPN